MYTVHVHCVHNVCTCIRTLYMCLLQCSLFFCVTIHFDILFIVCVLYGHKLTLECALWALIGVRRCVWNVCTHTHTHTCTCVFTLYLCMYMYVHVYTDNTLMGGKGQVSEGLCVLLVSCFIQAAHYHIGDNKCTCTLVL